jgi:hypothetical protein
MSRPVFASTLSTASTIRLSSLEDAAPSSNVNSALTKRELAKRSKWCDWQAKQLDIYNKSLQHPSFNQDASKVSSSRRGGLLFGRLTSALVGNGK